ncbi:O-antigen ligase family protein [Pseudomonas oryzae]|uniref:O-antigen ligase-related domain-containing protein n=1 Tax=Pseudomonas oryzae TaxID=1392877 RepID=A0A1H1VU49_9PSED|nr:O-antigen ligase family protein [Pseudomonas oryzae]SDS88447.1 hypothetical protein SAMN05216221_2881 [Pseudomonas oryzae]
MRIDGGLAAWWRLRAESAGLAHYLSVMLLAFLLSYFLLDYAKYRNNIYYALFAVPALLFAVPAAWRNWPGWAGGCLLLYFLGGLLADGLSGDPVLRLLKHQLYLLLLFGGLCLCVREGRGFRLAGLVYAIACLLFACLAVYLWLEAYRASGVPPRIRLYAGASNPVHASLMILTGWLGFWVVYGLPKLLERGRLAYLCGFALMLGFAFLVCIVFQSRSALLGLLAVLGGWLVLGRERALSLLLIGALLLLVLVSGGYEALLARGVSYRADIWQDALLRLRDHCSWVLGCTQAGRPLYLGQFHHAHSAYLSILVETGLLGAVTFVAFALVYVVQGVRTRSSWFIVSLAGWAGVIASSSGLVDSPRPLWIYFWLPTLLALLDFRRSRTPQESAAS